MNKKCNYEGPGRRLCNKKAVYECPYCGTKMCLEHTKEMGGEFPPYYCSNFDCKPRLFKIHTKKAK